MKLTLKLSFKIKVFSNELDPNLVQKGLMACWEKCFRVNVMEPRLTILIQGLSLNSRSVIVFDFDDDIINLFMKKML